MALDEFERAAEWYFERSPDVGVRFAQAVQEAVDRIRFAPLAAPINEFGERRIRIGSRFPYSLVYKVYPGELVQLVAVAHSAREPGYWRGRL